MWNLTTFAVLALAAANVAAAAGPQTVSILHGQFSPATVTVQAGDSVAWVNNDDSDHAVVAADGSFQSGVLKRGDQFEHTFTTAGTFAYTDALHPRMRGTVAVK